MADQPPSPLLEGMATVWRHLYLRSDIDDLILEMLGRFSLEKIYAAAGNREVYQQLVISLLTKLSTIFFMQRLTIPTDNTHVAWYLGFLVSWEVAMRSVEFILQTVVEGRESLWESTQLRNQHLAEFLLSALRVVALHPKAPANQPAKDRRERFGRIRGSLEQVFDSYPGRKSFLLEVCKEMINQLHTDPNCLSLPTKLRAKLPNLANDLYPPAECLTSPYIEELVTYYIESGAPWLAELLALRDISQFWVGASIQHTADRRTQDASFQASCVRARNTILNALSTIHLPSNLSTMEMVSAVGTTFRIILPNTPQIGRWDTAEPAFDDYQALDTLQSFAAKLAEREVVHRVSDKELMHSVSQVITSIMQEDPGSQYLGGRPGLYMTNCPEFHLLGEVQLRYAGYQLSSNLIEVVHLPRGSACLQCGQSMSVLREIPLARQTFELLQPLQTSVEAAHFERHLPTQFHLEPPRLENGNGGSHFGRYHSTSGEDENHSNITSTNPPPTDRERTMSQSGATDSHPLSASSTTELWHSEGSSHMTTTPLDDIGEITKDYVLPLRLPPPPNTLTPQRESKTAEPPNSSISQPPTAMTIFPNAKGKSKWKLFSSKPKSPTAASGDSSTLSEGTVEAQKLEEIPLAGLLGSHNSASKTKASKNIKVYLSQNSTLALFWTQAVVHVWDIGTSPPSPIRAVAMESTCILAAVGKEYFAYIIGTRDQRLTLRIMSLDQPSAPVVEYRMPSSPWCKCIAIDRKENYVVVGFENCVVRFFKASRTEKPKEDRLHRSYRHDCKNCPPVETLSFSNDGLVLLASIRSPRTGVIQVYSWRFPFIDFQELASCRYPVTLHESEDNGISSTIFRSGSDLEPNLVCLTTWTQSGTPVLVHPQEGHRTEIKLDISGRNSKLGNRIQCASFSSRGDKLAMVNEHGYLYRICNLNSTPMDIQKIATSKTLTAKTDSIAMSFMRLQEEEYIVLAWADSAKGTGWIKKISPAGRAPRGNTSISTVVYKPMPPAELESVMPPAELPATQKYRARAKHAGDDI